MLFINDDDKEANDANYSIGLYKWVIYFVMSLSLCEMDCVVIVMYICIYIYEWLLDLYIDTKMDYVVKICISRDIWILECIMEFNSPWEMGPRFDL